MILDNFRFDREYLLSRSRCRQAENGVINYNATHVHNFFHELWFTDHTVYTANVYPPKINSAHNLWQLYTLNANISQTDQAIDKQKMALSTTITSTFDEKIEFDPLTTNFMPLMFTHPKKALHIKPR